MYLRYASGRNVTLRFEFLLRTGSDPVGRYRQVVEPLMEPRYRQPCLVLAADRRSVASVSSLRCSILCLRFSFLLDFMLLYLQLLAQRQHSKRWLGFLLHFMLLFH